MMRLKGASRRDVDNDAEAAKAYSGDCVHGIGLLPYGRISKMI